MLDIFRVGFIGHREVSDFRYIEDRLDAVIGKLISQKEFVEFYVGRNGEFDIMVASSVKRRQRDFGTYNNSLILVLPYPVADTESYEKFYDEVLLPPELYKVHYKAAIQKRNDWIIYNSDLLIMHVTREKGNAAKCMKKAIKIGKKIINITAPKSPFLR